MRNKDEYEKKKKKVKRKIWKWLEKYINELKGIQNKNFENLDSFKNELKIKNEKEEEEKKEKEKEKREKEEEKEWNYHIHKEFRKKKLS